MRDRAGGKTGARALHRDGSVRRMQLAQHRADLVFGGWKRDALRLALAAGLVVPVVIVFVGEVTDECTSLLNRPFLACRRYVHMPPILYPSKVRAADCIR